MQSNTQLLDDLLGELNIMEGTASRFVTARPRLESLLPWPRPVQMKRTAVSTDNIGPTGRAGEAAASWPSW